MGASEEDEEEAIRKQGSGLFHIRQASDPRYPELGGFCDLAEECGLP